MKRGSLKMLDDEIQLSLSYIQPNIKTLCSSYQAHVSHSSFKLRFFCKMILLVSEVKSYLCLLN